jgi:putative component of membrane protein insertase Oxa1/YidC/SpoIIIJ protein YidD
MSLVETIELIKEPKTKVELNILKDIKDKCIYAETCSGYNNKDYICNGGKGRYHGVNLTTRCHKPK